MCNELTASKPEKGGFWREKTSSQKLLTLKDLYTLQRKLYARVYTCAPKPKWQPLVLERDSRAFFGLSIALQGFLYYSPPEFRGNSNCSEPPSCNCKFFGGVVSECLLLALGSL